MTLELVKKMSRYAWHVYVCFVLAVMIWYGRWYNQMSSIVFDF